MIFFLLQVNVQQLQMANTVDGTPTVPAVIVQEVSE
jgi:hypothetical protein